MTRTQSLFVAAVRRQHSSARYGMRGDVLVVSYPSVKPGHMVLTRVNPDGSRD